MLAKAIQIFLLVMTCGFAILTVELPNLLYAAIALFGMSVSLGGLFWLLRAPYVAVFQLLVYAGAVVALFVVIIMLTVGGRVEEETRRMDKIGAAGIFISAIAASLALMVIQSWSFPLFGYTSYEINFVRALADTVGKKVSHLLWTDRALDLIAQAFLLLTAALACLALLRPEGSSTEERITSPLAEAEGLSENASGEGGGEK